jgi:hypothetical protein
VQWDITTLDGLRWSPVQSIRDLPDSLEVAFLCLLDQFVSDDTQATAATT